MTFDQIISVYRGSDATATRELYAKIATFAPRGFVAVKLLQTCKASERAKLYRRSRYRGAAYDKKDWAISELCRAMLVACPDVIESWGWGLDPKAIGFENVLYVDLPGAGQVSFHTDMRRDGPDYAGAWDGVRGVAPDRICLWAEAVMAGREVVSNEGERDVARQDRAEAGPVERAPGSQDDEGQQEALDL